MSPKSHQVGLGIRVIGVARYRSRGAVHGHGSFVIIGQSPEIQGTVGLVPFVCAWRHFSEKPAVVDTLLYSRELSRPGHPVISRWRPRETCNVKPMVFKTI